MSKPQKSKPRSHYDTAAMQFYKAAKTACEQRRKASSVPTSTIRNAAVNLFETLSKILKMLAASPQEP
jgi:hypothetical protein